MIKAIQEIYGVLPGLVIVGGKIRDWPYSEPIPSEEQLAEIAQTYAAKVQYKIDRERAYPTIQEQLDILYHQGYDGWKAAIKAVKDNYPKPQ